MSCCPFQLPTPNSRETRRKSSWLCYLGMEGVLFAPACPHAKSKELVLNGCAYLLSTDTAWALVCLLCRHQNSYYMTKCDLHFGSISAGLTQQNSQHKKMLVPSPLPSRSQKATSMASIFSSGNHPGLLQSLPGTFEVILEGYCAGRISQRALQNTGSQTSLLEILTSYIGPRTLYSK